MTSSEWVDAIALECDRMVDVLRSVDLDTPVPSCPDWVGRDLIRHLGGVHHWARTIVGTRRQSPIDEDLETQVGGWPNDEGLLPWFERGCADLVTTLREAPTELQCWTFLRADSPHIHWARRQAHETAIHRVDAELTAGVEVTPFDPDFASDGIDELLTAFITRPRRGPRAERPTTFGVFSTDTGRVWTVYYDQTKVNTEHVADPDTDASVRGSASDLYQWLWHRIHRDSVEIVGDQAVVDHWNDVRVRWS